MEQVMLIEEIRRQITTRLQEKELTVGLLEKKTGLPKNVIRNIMSGGSNNPGIASLEAIARVLNCSIDELVGRRYSNQFQSNTKLTKEYKWVEELFLSTSNHAMKYIKKHGYSITLEKMLFFLKGAYTYSLEKGSHEVDKKFLEWLIEKNTD
jgi:transcriptional regulator with XRE-family HTH domain